MQKVQVSRGEGVWLQPYDLRVLPVRVVLAMWSHLLTHSL